MGTLVWIFETNKQFKNTVEITGKCIITQLKTRLLFWAVFDWWQLINVNDGLCKSLRHTCEPAPQPLATQPPVPPPPLTTSTALASLLCKPVSLHLHHPGSHQPALELPVLSYQGIILVINTLILDLQSRYFLGSSSLRLQSCDQQDRCCCLYIVQSMVCCCHISPWTNYREPFMVGKPTSWLWRWLYGISQNRRLSQLAYWFTELSSSYYETLWQRDQRTDRTKVKINILILFSIEILKRQKPKDEWYQMSFWEGDYSAQYLPNCLIVFVTFCAQIWQMDLRGVKLM